MICKNCGKEFDGKFCPDCGTMVEEQSQQDLTQCPNCGAERVDNGKFCVNCGYNFVDPTQSVSAGKPKLSLNNFKLNKFLSVFAKVYRWLIAGGMIFVGIVSLLCLTAPVITESFLGESNPLCSGFVAIGGGSQVDVSANVVNVCITLLVVSIFCILYGAAQLSIAFQEPYSKIKNKIFWIIDGAISLILIILGAVVAGEVGSEEFMDGRLGSGFAMCIVMGVFGLVFLGLRIFYELKLFKWEDTGLTEEQIAKAKEKKERKPIDKEKVKKIAIRVGIPVIVVAVLIAVIVPTVAWANNIFRVGKVDKINIGDSQEQVIKILGEPYEKSDNRFEYYSNDYIKLVEQIKKLTGNSKNLTTNMAKDEDWDIDWDEDIDLDEDIDIGDNSNSSASKLDKLYAQLEEMTYKYIRVDFDTANKVSEVFFDNNKYNGENSENSKKRVNSYELLTNEIIQATITDIKYSVKFDDGSYYKGVAIQDYITFGKNSVRIEWSDEWKTYYDSIMIKENQELLLVAYDSENLYSTYSNGVMRVESYNSYNKINHLDYMMYLQLQLNKIVDKLGSGEVLDLSNLSNLPNVFERDRIVVDDNNAVYKVDGNCLIKKDDNSLVFGCKNSLIPNYVTHIGDYAFDGCSSLTSIVIPSSVTSIGEYAFRGCSNLTIYCEAESQPSGWDSGWNRLDIYHYVPVVWGYKG